MAGRPVSHLVRRPRIGLALGGGGARGLAHVTVLETLDEMGITIDCIAGTSVGAIIGAAYCAGMRGAQMRHYIGETFSNIQGLVPKIWKVRPRNLSEKLSGSALPLLSIDPLRVLDTFLPDILPPTFDALQIPLTVVATDFYDVAETRFSSGPLHRAVAASIALPVVFKPVIIDGAAYVDGGAVNPLPFDALPPCDVIIAVDVVGTPVLDRAPKPSALEQLYGISQIMMQTITNCKLEHAAPDIVLRPAISRFRVMEFHKAQAIFAAAAPTGDELKRRLRALLQSIDYDPQQE